MKQLSGMVGRVMDAYNVSSFKDLALKLGIVESTARGWNHRGKVSKSALLKTSHDTGYLYDWLLTGEGEMYNQPEKTVPTISEVPDETRDGYQAHPDGAALFDRVELRLEQAEMVMLSDTQYAQELEGVIKKLYNLYRQESRQKSESSGR